MNTETLRHKLSARLMDTNERSQETINFAVPSGIAFDRCFQEPSEGIIWFHIKGADESDYIEFDDMKKKDLEEILKQL